MRNVIRNILTNWRNALGKSTNAYPTFHGFPYSFRVFASPATVYIESGATFPVRAKYIRYWGGSVHENGADIYSSYAGATFTASATRGTTFTIEQIEGEIVYLEINGTAIFDNR